MNRYYRVPSLFTVLRTREIVMGFTLNMVQERKWTIVRERNRLYNAKLRYML